MNNSGKNRTTEAVVRNVIPKGDHGPYVVATAEGFDGSITFSLKDTVWGEDKWPEPGDVVLLSSLTEKVAGWRANKARFNRLEDKQLAMSKELAMKEVKALLKRWKAKLFPTKTDETWEDWVDLKKRDWQELVGLVKDDSIADEFKARALFIILTPVESWIPFHWKREDDTISRHNGYLGLMQSLGVDFKTLSPELIKYVAELITIFYEYLKDQRDLEKYLKTMRAYNFQITSLVPYVQDEEAKELFRLFEFNDLAPYSNIGDGSGYNPLRYIFHARDLDDKWIRLAHEEMVQIIMDEVTGKKEPRLLDEDALTIYADIAMGFLHDEKDRYYSSELFFDQIRFFVGVAPDNNNCYGGKLIPDFQAGKIVKLIKAECNDTNDALLTFFSLFVMKRGFDIYNREELEAAELMLDVLKDDDKLRTVLQDEIVLGKKRLAEGKANQESKARDEKVVVAKMKRTTD